MFGEFTVESFAYMKEIGQIKIKSFSYWNCRCSCGRIETVKGTVLAQKARDKCTHCSRKLSKDLKRFEPGVVGGNAIYRVYKNRAVDIEKIFEFTREEFEVIAKSDCYYCGAAPSGVYKYPSGTPFIYNGLDRLDRKGHYTKENVVPCCKSCNYAKHVLTCDEFLEKVKRIYERHCKGDMERNN